MAPPPLADWSCPCKRTAGWISGPSPRRQSAVLFFLCWLWQKKARHRGKDTDANQSGDYQLLCVNGHRFTAFPRLRWENRHGSREGMKDVPLGLPPRVLIGLNIDKLEIVAAKTTEIARFQLGQSDNFSGQTHRSPNNCTFGWVAIKRYMRSIIEDWESMPQSWSNLMP